MEISFHTHLNSNTVITTKFCTWHDSCAVVACAKICCDLMASNRITARRSLHRICIAGKKSLVKRAPGQILPHACHAIVLGHIKQLTTNTNEAVKGSLERHHISGLVQDCRISTARKYKDYVYRKMLVQEYLKKWRIFKRVKPKNDMMYHDIYNCICQNTKK